MHWKPPYIGGNKRNIARETGRGKATVRFSKITTVQTNRNWKGTPLKPARSLNERSLHPVPMLLLSVGLTDGVMRMFLCHLLLPSGDKT